MKTYSVCLQRICSLTVLFIAVTVISVSLTSACYMDKKSSAGTVDMVVVFKADVPIEKASSILFEHEYIFYEGTDNRKGKKYFAETGPEYTVKVPREKIPAFNNDMKKILQIYEIYEAERSAEQE